MLWFMSCGPLTYIFLMELFDNSSSVINHCLASTIDTSDAVKKGVCNQKQRWEVKAKHIQAQRFSNVCIITCGFSFKV